MSVLADVAPIPELGATDYANKLLSDLGCAQALVPNPSAEHPAFAWVRSGLMLLTGRETPTMCPAPLAACADGVLEAIKSFGHHDLNQVEGSQLLAERAALMGLERNGRIAPGGSCRLLQGLDGSLAVNLARDEDWAMLPAWLASDEIGGHPDQWEALAALVAKRHVGELIERGRELGLAVAANEMPQAVSEWFKVLVQATQAIPKRAPVVLDLSALWAGPLCAHLLQKMGARVIKVESTSRLDGSRLGNADFYNLLNAGKASVTLDLTSDLGREQLRGLIAQADMVIESARPRGLRQMGVIAEELVAQQPGLIWLSISAYGREAETCNWVGFGDDVAIAAGSSNLMEVATGESMFVGDAIADPLTGMHAALAAWSIYQQGGGRLVSISMKDVMSHCLQFGLPKSAETLKQRQLDWTRLVATEDFHMPEPRVAEAAAAEPGQDTHNILTEFGLITGK